MEMARRNFIKATLLWPILMACGKSSGSGATTPPGTSGNCLANGTSVTVGSNHGHTAPVITATNVATGNQQVFSVAAGTAGHSHSVTVTAANFTTLQTNTGVLIQTDADGTGHSHGITINCA